MNKLGLKVSALLVSASFALAGCSGASTNQANKEDSGKIKVYTSFYPMYDFTSKIGGDKVDVINLVPSGTEPHDWEPSAQDLVKIGEADMFVYSGAGMEGWVEKLDENIKNDKLVKIEASKGVELIKNEEGHDHHDSEEGHNDAKEGHDHHDAEEGHEHNDAKEGHDHHDAEEGHDHHDAEEGHHHHGAYDPHVWLAPLNAKTQMKNILDGLVKADPNNKDYYQKNYDTYAKKLDELDAKYKSELSKTTKKDIVVSHEAFAYLCKAYGINQVGIEGVSPDSEPDAAKMKEVAEFAKKNQVKYIFFEELVSPKVAETIAKEVGAKTEVLSPLEGLTEEQIKDGQDYFTIMEKNLTNILAALK